MAKKLTKTQMREIKAASKQIDASSVISAKYNLQKVTTQYQRLSKKGKTRNMIESEKEVRRTALKNAKAAAANEELQMFGDFLENVNNMEKNKIIRWLHENGYAVEHYTYREDLILSHNAWKGQVDTIKVQLTKKQERLERELEEADKWADEFLSDWG